MTDPTAWIWDIRKYSLHDGPGIRTTVFFKGCPLKCLWCCNPESHASGAEVVWIRERCLACDLCLESCARYAISVDPSGRRVVDPASCDLCGVCAHQCPGEAMTIVGRQMTVDEVLAEVARDAIFYSRSGGGLTLSGGEPLAQPEFAAELLARYKRSEGGHTAVETCGQADWDEIRRLLPYVDLFLYDIKHMDALEHRRYTGAGNLRILENASRIATSGRRLVIRFPLIPGCNDGEDNVRRTAALARSLGVERVDLLPYHRLGEPKYTRLDRRYVLAGTNAPSEDRVAAARRIIDSYGLAVRVGG